jgi:hypothetical protein
MPKRSVIQEVSAAGRQAETAIEGQKNGGALPPDRKGLGIPKFFLFSSILCGAALKGKDIR